MKTLVACLLLFGSSVALADTLTVLSRPAPPPNSISVALSHCASIGFATDGTIFGACKYTTGSCGRYCTGPTATYITTWDAAGYNPVRGALCATTNGGLAGHVTTTYVAPHDASDCSVTYGTHTTVVIDGYPFYYVTTATDGRELVNTNAESYLWSP
jgi:hypothetical protein